MSRAGFLLLTLTGVVAALAAVLAYAILRLFAATRRLSRSQREPGEPALMSVAVEDALQKLKVEGRKAQERAEASERLSSEIISSMTSGLLVVGDDRRIRTINPAGARLLGLPDDNFTGQNVHQVLQPVAPLAIVIEECLASGKPILRRAVAVPGGPAATHLGVTVSPITNELGVAHGAICLFSDLSQIFELEDQLRLKDSLARVGEMTAGIAHEFRNGLATIHGYARLIELDRLPEEFRPYVMAMREETDTLRAVVTNFLNFAKPTPMMPAPVEMRTLVDRLVDEIRADVGGHGGRVNVSGEFGTIDGDEVLLRQAFSNICRNALEACDGAGVAPEIGIDGEVDAGVRQQRIAISDNGGGIKERDAERIFQPFFTTRAQGTGLGLALVQKIVVTHNGRITVEPSKDGRGSRFLITLPLA